MLWLLTYANMNDKVYLHPGTHVGERNTKAGVKYDVCDP